MRNLLCLALSIAVVLPIVASAQIAPGFNIKRLEKRLQTDGFINGKNCYWRLTNEVRVSAGANDLKIIHNISCNSGDLFYSSNFYQTRGGSLKILDGGGDFTGSGYLPEGKNHTIYVTNLDPSNDGYLEFSALCCPIS